MCVWCIGDFNNNKPVQNIRAGLTHWGRVTHICVSKLPIIGSDNGLSPGRHQAIIWTNAGILLIGPLGTNFSEISIVIHTFSFKKIHMRMSSGKWRPSCLGLNDLIDSLSFQIKATRMKLIHTRKYVDELALFAMPSPRHVLKCHGSSNGYDQLINQMDHLKNKTLTIILYRCCSNQPHHINHINPFWRSDAIWRLKRGSTFAKVMACCLTAPSHYRNLCWLIISNI